MSRTIRAYHSRMCLRSQRNRPHKVEQSLLKDLQHEFDINLGNRALLRAVPEPYDDVCVSALSETKHMWKHNRLPQTKYRYRAS
jgi:hypothetical protein